MSIKLMSFAWDLDIPSTEKMVLLCLCDFANDEGYCWPSVGTLKRKTSKSERTVQSSLKWLSDHKFITRNERKGTSTNYRIHPRRICTPAESAPPQKTTYTPAESAPKPSREPSIKKDTKVSKKVKPFSKPENVSDEVWDDFVKHRKAKRSPVSQTAINGIKKEADLAGWTLEKALAEIVTRGWQGFKAEWVGKSDPWENLEFGHA